MDTWKFTEHAALRLAERTPLTQEEFGALLNSGKCVPLGYEAGKRLHTLFYSPTEERWHVAVLDERTWEVITVLPPDYRNAFKVCLPDVLAEAKAAWGSSEPAQLGFSTVRLTLCGFVGISTGRTLQTLKKYHVPGAPWPDGEDFWEALWGLHGFREHVRLELAEKTPEDFMGTLLVRAGKRGELRGWNLEKVAEKLSRNFEGKGLTLSSPVC